MSYSQVNTRTHLSSQNIMAITLFADAMVFSPFGDMSPFHTEAFAFRSKVMDPCIIRGYKTV
jgi:hypothetical protein